MWCIYAMEYYTAIKQNEVMQFATAQMYLEGIITSEVSQTGKEKYCMTPPYMWNIK